MISLPMSGIVVGLPFYWDIIHYEPGGSIQEDRLFRISKSLTNDAEFATVYKADALSPVIPRGAVVLLRSCPIEALTYDNAYYVVTSYTRSWRFILQGADAAHVRLTTCCPGIYEDREILRGLIRNLYAVCAVFVLDPPCK